MGRLDLAEVYTKVFLTSLAGLGLLHRIMQHNAVDAGADLWGG